jgi:hypothetical protein
VAPALELKGTIMRNRTSIYLSAALLTVLAAIPVADAAADSGFWRGRTITRHPSPGFDVSGEFTGTLGGEILLAGVSYRLASDAVVYEIGRGLLPLGTMVVDRHVFLSGLGSDESGLIRMVIVRPPDDPRLAKRAPTIHTRLEDDASPQ